MPFGQKTKSIKQKQYCNKFKKDFTNGPHQKSLKKKKKKPLKALHPISMQCGSPRGCQTCRGSGKTLYGGLSGTLPLPSFQIFGNHCGAKGLRALQQEVTVSVGLELPALGPRSWRIKSEHVTLCGSCRAAPITDRETEFWQ